MCMKSLKIILVAIVTMAVLPYAQAQSFLTNGLVAYYPLNGNAKDVSGNGINGTVVSAVPAKDRFGTNNHCYSFNGNAQYIYAAADNLPSGPRTISLWFKANEVDIEPVFLGYGGGCGSSFFMGLNDSESGTFGVWPHCGTLLEVPYSSPPTNVWDQWVVVMDNVGMSSYLNGNLIGSQAVTTTTAVAGTQLGLGVASADSVPYTDGSVGYLDGYLDDVRIYNLALSASQVQQLYALESSTPDSPSITLQPQGQTVKVGGSATFTVGVNGMPTLSYQWLSNNVTISGARSNSYTIPNVQPVAAANYSVVVSNAAGVVTSSAAVLTVQEFPHAAIGYASVVNGFVVGVTLTDNGYGYTNTPAVRFIGGGGSGAAATAVVSNGLVIAVNVSITGSGYTNPPVVVIAPPYIQPPTMGIVAMSLLSFTNLAVGTNYQFQSYFEGTLSNIGAAFIATSPTFTQYVSGTVVPNNYRMATSNALVQAYVTAQVVNGFVVGINVINGGSGYSPSAPPTVTIRGCNGTNATAVAQVSGGGAVTNINITNPGFGYCTNTTVTIAPPTETYLLPNIDQKSVV